VIPISIPSHRRKYFRYILIAACLVIALIIAIGEARKEYEQSQEPMVGGDIENSLKIEK
jgi:hypothetical protein